MPVPLGNGVEMPNYWLSWNYDGTPKDTTKLVGSRRKTKWLLLQNAMDDRRNRPDVCFSMTYMKTWALNAVLNGYPLVPVLDDIQSIHVCGSRNVLPYDRIWAEHAAGFITASEGFMPFVEQVTGEKPNYFYLPLKYSRKELRFKKRQTRPKTVVYVGGLISPIFTQTTHMEYDYRDMSSYFKEILDAGWEVHCYTPNWEDPRSRAYYKALGCKMHGFLAPPIYEEISKYEVGIMGYREGCNPYALVCTPNKTFDYLGAGIPTLGVGETGMASDIFVKGGWGTVKKKNEKMATALERARSIVITDELRESQVIDYHLEPLQEWLANDLDMTKHHLHKGLVYDGRFVPTEGFNDENFPQQNWVWEAVDYDTPEQLEAAMRRLQRCPA